MPDTTRSKLNGYDICILYIGKRIAAGIENQLAPMLRAIGVRLRVQTGEKFDRDPSTVLLTTPHSFKGYDAEIVVVAAVDNFVAQSEGILANTLYVAMTRARAILALFGMSTENDEGDRILSELEDCLDLLTHRPKVEKHTSCTEEFENLVRQLGEPHRTWLAECWKSRWFQLEPIITEEGEILAEPLFWFRNDERTYACFGNQSPSQRVLETLEEVGIEVLSPGQRIGD